MTTPAQRAEEVDALKARLSRTAGGPERTEILLSLGRLLFVSDPQEALSCLDEAYRLASRAGDHRQVARSSNMLAHIHMDLRNDEQAKGWAQRALDAARESGVRQHEAGAYKVMAEVLEVKGEFDQAREHFEKALAASEEGDYAEGRCAVLNGLGNLCYEQGRLQDALDYYRRSLVLAAEIDDTRCISGIHINLGLILQLQGKWEESAEHLFRAIAISEEYGYRSDLLCARNTLGEVYLKRNRLEEAVGIFTDVVTEERQNPTDRRVLGDALLNLGLAHFASGDHGAAERAFSESTVINEEVDDRKQLARLYICIAELAVAKGQLERAKTYIARASRLAEDLDLRIEKGDVWRLRGRVRAEEGDIVGAAESFDRAISQLAETPDSYELAQTRLQYAKHLIAIGEPANAEPLLRLAAETFKGLSIVAGSEEANRLLYELEKPSDTEAALVGAIKGLATVGLEPGLFFEHTMRMLCESLGFENGAVIAGERPVVLHGWPEVETAVELRRQGGVRYEKKALSLPIEDNGNALGSVFLGRSKSGSLDKGKAVLADIAQILVEPLRRLTQLSAAPAEAEAVVPGLQYRGFVGSSPQVIDGLKTVARVASAAIPVLIRGESGTGKELTARALHESGARRDKPFVAINCAAVPETLLEAEFFGVEKGAATGVVARKGKFEQADGGTVFLDEIGDMSTALQARLLRVLQEKTVEPVGGQKRVEIDIRIIAATNQPLEELMNQGKFRSDLFYRLNAIEIALPRLRERKADIPEFVRYFITRSNQEFGRELTGASSEVIGRLMAYEWPGNIRQLQHVIERSVVLAKGKVLEVTDLPHEFQQLHPVEVEKVAGGGLRNARQQARAQATQDYERAMIVEYLDKADWNVSKAAELAGYSRAQFYRLMNKNKVSRPK